MVTDYLTPESPSRGKPTCPAGHHFQKFFGLPISMFIKKCPLSPRESINDHINPKPLHCYYPLCDNVVHLATQHRVDSLFQVESHKCLQSHLGLSKGLAASQLYMGIRATNGTVQKKYYMYLFSPFGLHSSPMLFNEYVSTLEYAMCINHISYLLHYLDDYFTTSPQLILVPMQQPQSLTFLA